MDLATTYETRPNIRLQVRQIMASAFLPVPVVRLASTTLEYNADLFYQYFRNEWLTIVHPSIRNVYREDTRTNNDRGMASTLQQRHWQQAPQHLRISAPHAFMQDEQAPMELLHQHIILGRIAHCMCRHLRLQKYLEKLTRRNDRGTISLVEYLTAVSCYL